MKNLDPEQKKLIKKILEYYRRQSHKSVKCLCDEIFYENRNIYYRVGEGLVDSDDVYIAFAIVSNVEYTTFVNEYLPSCNIALDTQFLRNRLIVEYIKDHSSSKAGHYNIAELNSILCANGVAPL